MKSETKRNKKTRGAKKRDERVISFEAALEERAEKRADPAGSREAATEAKPPKRRRRAFAFRKLYVAGLAVMLLLASFYALRLAAMQAAATEAVTARDAALRERDRLEAELEYVDDPAYVEQQARTRLRMIKPGEMLYITPNAEAGISDTPLSGVTPDDAPDEETAP